MSIIDGVIAKKIEHYFGIEQKIKAAVQDIRHSQLYGSSKPEYTGGGGHAHVSDRTAIRAVELASPIRCISIENGRDTEQIRRPEDWIEVLDGTKQRFADSPIAAFMHKRYAEGQDWKQTCTDLYIERDTYYKWRDNVVTYATLLAVQGGLVKVR